VPEDKKNVHETEAMNRNRVKETKFNSLYSYASFSCVSEENQVDREVIQGVVEDYCLKDTNEGEGNQLLYNSLLSEL